MSGIAGIIHMRGKPVDRRLLQAMTLTMARRGPDDQKIWLSGHVGLGHAMLQTSIDTAAKEQPCSLDGSIWITADARVDRRKELMAALGSGCDILRRKPADVELILSAYRKWGSDCVNHLQGDFCFAIWDGYRNELFCARDHFGIKPFYYCRIKDWFIFSNTMNCLRLHPQVSSALNEQTVADLLLFGFSIHPDISLFRDIQKLPAGHSLTVGGAENFRCGKYWELPTEELRRVKRAEECVEEFHMVFHRAVDDRLRTDRVGVLMSGGLDSTSVAAAARRVLASRFDPFDLRAFTLVHQWTIEDQEAVVARQAAEAIGIPAHNLTVDAYNPNDVSSAARAMRSLLESSFTEPSDSAGAFLAPNGCRVGICGYGGDELFHPGFTDLKTWLKKIRLTVLILDTLLFWRTHGRLPAIGLRTYIRNQLGKNRRVCQPPYPPWLNREFEQRLNLQQQWQTYLSKQPAGDPVRSAAVHGLTHPLWHNLFESFDPGMTGIPVELRFPYLDLRLVAFCLQLPPIPWCVDKLLLRQAGRKMLPDAVKLRPKTPLNGYPDYQQLLDAPASEKTITEISDEFAAYIDISRYRTIARQPHKLRPGEHTLITHPLRLARWLHYLDESNHMDKGRSSWQIPKRNRSTRRPITPPGFASMEISTA